MRIRDPILFAYFKTCGGQMRYYPRWLQQLGLRPGPGNRRYSATALMPMVVAYMRKLERDPTGITMPALLSAEDAVKRATFKLSKAGNNARDRKAAAARLFYAMARREALKSLLPDYTGEKIKPEPQPAIRRPAGVAARLARAWYNIKVQSRLELNLQVEAADATALAKDASAAYEIAKAELTLKTEALSMTLAARRVEVDNARLPPGARKEHNALIEKTRNLRRILAKLQPTAQAKRARLAKCRQRISEQRAVVAALELNKFNQ